jgi:2-oxoglutarate dehydrogenase E2 component (dihydrolipoamide succinyltransferase)
MPTQVIMPQLGESVVEGTITRWLKQKGEQVEEYEPLLEVNTDKVDSEIPSPVSGTLLEILVPADTTVRAGELLAWIGEAGEQAAENGKSGGETPGETAAEVAPEAEAPESAKPLQAGVSAPAAGRDSSLGFISPVVARIAAEHRVDLSRVSGTGQGGRITKKDILAYLEKPEGAGAEIALQAAPAPAREAPRPVREEPAPAPIPAAIPQPQAAPPPPAATAGALAGELLPHTLVRRAIAEHMVNSKRTSPHVTTVFEADLSRVAAHREANKAAFAQDGANLTYTAYLVSAAVAALKAYPLVNSSWSDEGLILHREINIGMAVSLGGDGLIVPVIKNADHLSLLGLARTINDLADRARARQLQPAEVKGGTFTLTNHGTSGSLFATPIINQPQCGILGAGAIQKRVVVVSADGVDAIAIRPMVYLSLTFDHRILDGAVADYFLGKVVESLQIWA